MAARVKLELLEGVLVLTSLACGQTSRRNPNPTEPVLGHGGEGGSAGVQQAGSGAALAAGAGGSEAACVAFCTARQIHIQHCTDRDGDRALRETYDVCFESAESSQFGLCPTNPSCGGWLAGCIRDAINSVNLEAFPPNTTCADSVEAKLFRPSP